jgi:linearmycin/streptolysin S transport system permease protein
VLAQLRAAILITRRILRQRIRDRSAILFAIVTPLGLAIAFGLLVPNDFTAFHTHFEVVDEDGGPIAAALIDGPLAQIAEAGVADVAIAASEDAALAVLRAGDAGAVIVIPPGFSDAVGAARPTEIRVLGGEFPASLAIARSVVARFASDIGAVQLMVSTARRDGATADATLVGRATDALRGDDPIRVDEISAPARQAGRQTFYAAAMAIMFVFFATQYGALAIHADRQTGTLTRLLAAPISAGAILFGAALASMALGIVSMSVLAVASTLLVGAHWGPPLAVGVLILAAAVAASGVSLLVASLARTPQQASGLNAMVAISLAAIGGVFIPLSQAPDSIVALAQITPHAWFMRGIDTLADPMAGITDILVFAGVLLGMGVILGAIGLLRARRALVS